MIMNHYELELKVTKDPFDLESMMKEVVEKQLRAHKLKIEMVSKEKLSPSEIEAVQARLRSEAMDFLNFRFVGINTEQ